MHQDTTIEEAVYDAKVLWVSVLMPDSWFDHQEISTVKFTHTFCRDMISRAGFHQDDLMIDVLVKISGLLRLPPFDENGVTFSVPVGTLLKSEYAGNHLLGLFVRRGIRLSSEGGFRCGGCYLRGGRAHTIVREWTE